MIKNKKYRIAVNKILKVIIKEHKPKKVILFGSCLTSSKPNDIDMLIVKETDKKRFTERVIEVRETTDKILKNISFEPFVITPEEYENLLRRGHPFLKEIIETGEVLYGK